MGLSQGQAGWDEGAEVCVQGKEKCGRGVPPLGGMTQSTGQLGPDGGERPSAPAARTAVLSLIKQLRGVVDDAGTAPAARRAPHAEPRASTQLRCFTSWLLLLLFLENQDILASS